MDLERIAAHHAENEKIRTRAEIEWHEKVAAPLKSAADVTTENFSVNTVIGVLIELGHSDERIIEILTAMELMDR